MKRSVNDRFKKIVNFTLPAFQTKDGFKTCPNAGNCAAGCYARMGAYVWPKVYAKHKANLDTTFTDMFISQAIIELQKLKPDLVRIHDSGDFYSSDYLAKWCAIMIANPTIQFYAYTKMVRMFKVYTQVIGLPTNFTVIFSLGGKQDGSIDTEIDRHSKVFASKNELQTNGYIDTSHDDTNAIGSNPKVGLIYHGTKSYSNTAWDKVR